MRPSKTAVKEKSVASRAAASGKENVDGDVSLKRALYPALALPNNPDIRVCVHCLKCHSLIKRLCKERVYGYDVYHIFESF